MRVALVLVGDEILSGRTADANGPWIAGRLAEAGARLVECRTVPDDEGRIAGAVREVAAGADAVLVVGGLGPTPDDRTRHGVARALGVPLAEDPAAWAGVVAALARRGRTAGEAQRRQALLPRGAEPLANREGTAPGVAADLGGALLLVLPGVPREARAMFEAQALPRLAARGGLEPPAVHAVFVVARSEADVASALGDLWHAPGLAVGSYPHEGELEVRFAARGPGAEARAREAAAEAARRLGAAAVGSRPVAETVVGLLRERGLRVTVAESMTGGLVAALLTDVPGASEVFPGGWVAYSDPWKADALGVPADLLARHGAVSEPAARAMAEGALARAGADAALAVTGSAGPSAAPGPSGPVPPGTAYAAVALRGRPTVASRHDLAGLPRMIVRRRMALLALDGLRRALLAGVG